MGTLLHDGLVETAVRTPEHPAVLAGERLWTFAELDGLSNAFAHTLDQRQVRPGERVIVMTTNRFEFVVAVQGISKVGAAAVLVNPGWKAAEVRHAVALTEPVLGVADGAAADVLGAFVSVIDFDRAGVGDERAAARTESRCR